MKVLIIDDSPEALAVAKARLLKENLELLCAQGGQAGLIAARREKPDLVLLDLDMPDMSGFDVCRRLKADPELGMTPVIFLAASDDTQDKVRGLDLGAVDYVTKPFDAFELRARVRAALRTKRLQDLLIKYAQIDPLTELPNRRALRERLCREWARFQRHGSPLSFIMADIDGFKRVNDVHGHPRGDRVLRQVADVLASHCRQSDFPARYGGDEFAVVVPDEHAEGAAQLAERFRQELTALRPGDEDGEDIRLGASFGVAEAAGLDSAEALVRQADAAMYRAKAQGRNRVEVAPAQPAAEPAR